jgi:hypothetical protein
VRRNSIDPIQERHAWQEWCRTRSWDDIPPTLVEAEERLVLDAMRFSKNNKNKVCRILGMTYPRLLRYLRLMGLLALVMQLNCISLALAQDTIVADSTSKIPVLVPGEGVTEAIGRWLYQRKGCTDTGIVYLTLNVEQNAWIDSVDALARCRSNHYGCLDSLGFYRGNSQLAWQTAEREELLIDTLRASLAQATQQVLEHRQTIIEQEAVIDTLDKQYTILNFNYQVMQDSVLKELRTLTQWNGTLRNQVTQMDKRQVQQAVTMEKLLLRIIALEKKLP